MFSLLIAVALLAQTSAFDEISPEVRASYCLDVLEMQSSLASSTGRPAEAEALLGASSENRAANQARLRSFLSARASTRADSELAAKHGREFLAKDMTELIFAAPSPTCRQSTAGLCRLEAFVLATSSRQANCTGELDWLPID